MSKKKKKHNRASGGKTTKLTTRNDFRQVMGELMNAPEDTHLAEFYKRGATQDGIFYVSYPYTVQENGEVISRDILLTIVYIPAMDEYCISCFVPYSLKVSHFQALNDIGNLLPTAAKVKGGLFENHFSIYIPLTQVIVKNLAVCLKAIDGYCTYLVEKYAS